MLSARLYFDLYHNKTRGRSPTKKMQRDPGFKRLTGIPGRVLLAGSGHDWALAGRRLLLNSLPHAAGAG